MQVAVGFPPWLGFSRWTASSRRLASGRRGFDVLDCEAAGERSSRGGDDTLSIGGGSQRAERESRANRIRLCLSEPINLFPRTATPFLVKRERNQVPASAGFLRGSDTNTALPGSWQFVLRFDSVWGRANKQTCALQHTVRDEAGVHLV